MYDPPPPDPRPRHDAARRAALGLGLLAGLAGAAAGQTSHCVDCHVEQADAERGLPHDRVGVGCVDCHGGDPDASTKETGHAASAGYRGVPERAAWPQLCGECHADVRRMNPFGIPTDQLARYRTSRHGEALFEEGETRAATCVDCHGAHGVRGPRDAESPVHATNVPATCARCHADPELVDEFGFDGDEYESYLGSVHAQALLEQGDLAAPQCATCHGNHGAVPPGFRTVGDVCGKCHVRERELFEQSPHAKLVEAGGFDACIVCHGNHHITPAEEAIFERTCQLCHEAGDDGLMTRDALLSELRATHVEFADARARLDAALERGLATEEDQLLLENARTSMVEMAAVQHSLDPAVLRTAAAGADQNLTMLQTRIEDRGALERAKRLSLFAVVGFLMLMSLGFYLRFRRLHAARGGAST